jgi:hypothetical protein
LELLSLIKENPKFKTSEKDHSFLAWLSMRDSKEEVFGKIGQNVHKKGWFSQKSKDQEMFVKIYESMAAGTQVGTVTEAF